MKISILRKIRNKALELLRDGDWDRKQRVFSSGGTRYYGDGGTIHNSNVLDIEIGPDGKVCAVWFRCQMLPFRQVKVDLDRANEMTVAYFQYRAELHGVEVKD